MSCSRSSVRFLFRSVVLSILAVIVISGPARAQVPMLQYDTTLKKMLNAVMANSYDKFVAEGDPRFQNGFTPKMFAELNRQLGAKLQQGHAFVFLTTLNQHEYVVYVWKLTFKSSHDDMLVTMMIKDGFVSGFFVR